MSGNSDYEVGSGFKFSQIKSPDSITDARAESFSVEPGGRAAAHGGEADGVSDVDSESTYWSEAPDATSQAAQALLDIQKLGSGLRRPGRRSLDAPKVVATPDASATKLIGVSAEMEALLSLMDEDDRKQYPA